MYSNASVSLTACDYEVLYPILWLEYIPEIIVCLFNTSVYRKPLIKGQELDLMTFYRSPHIQLKRKSGPEFNKF